ncbi:hypothetical protein F9L33_05705 [Amylibacter sp. SFDW26]|uniref:LysM peptidoglycan-binding domain-containing protein n=1 Tax=Amylibacter sp. SFDW26 TaxID=2652722 RepID=UPI0012628AB4|nr:LysM peptidoglycan-binding domain-containing protein [Amylibacter sp. SFDW26]KAB7616244.1 hypothetical protein F9L33_05705 [Amylibacter sp. SFDW26]
MATSLSSGLAIAGASAVVVVAMVTAYNVIVDDPAVTDEPAGLAAQNVLIAPPDPVVTEESAAKAATLPSFDIVRIDKSGAAVVAGKAAANITVSVRLDGQEIATSQSDDDGSFVALFDLPADTDPRELSLISIDDTGFEQASTEQVLVMPVAPNTEAAPKIIVAKRESIEVVKAEVKTAEETVTEPSGKAKDAPLSLDTIVYDDVGDVIVAGSGNSDGFVRLYLDNKPNKVEKIQDNGQWKITLSDVPEGVYALRVDTIDAAGTVKERVESPFKKEAAKKVVASSKSKATNVTIQPGFTLWQLAENRYGDGIRYVQIFEANRDIIKDPDLIYPGQIFDLPTQ